MTIFILDKANSHTQAHKPHTETHRHTHTHQHTLLTFTYPDSACEWCSYFQLCSTGSCGLGPVSILELKRGEKMGCIYVHIHIHTRVYACKCSLSCVCVNNIYMRTYESSNERITLSLFQKNNYKIKQIKDLCSDEDLFHSFQHVWCMFWEIALFCVEM